MSDINNIANESIAAILNNESKHEKPFKLVSWFPVIACRENVADDTCSLCRNFIYEKCILCINIKSYNPNNVCKIDYNTKCAHVYHLHCIQKWNLTNKTCPVDMIEWESSGKKKKENHKTKVMAEVE
jgi:RING-box protein 1